MSLLSLSVSGSKSTAGFLGPLEVRLTLKSELYGRSFGACEVCECECVVALALGARRCVLSHTSLACTPRIQQRNSYARVAPGESVGGWALYKRCVLCATLTLCEGRVVGRTDGRKEGRRAGRPDGEKEGGREGEREGGSAANGGRYRCANSPAASMAKLALLEASCSLPR